MGNLLAERSWQQPITPDIRKSLKQLAKSATINDVMRAANTIDPYQALLFASTLDELQHLTPRVPERTLPGQISARAEHATVLIEFEDDTVLVDPGLDVHLPRVQPSVIAITHAHYDHTGGLLKAAALYPHATILMSEETLALLTLSSEQSSAIRRLVEQRGRVVLADGECIRIADTNYRCYPAGHLLGALMIDIERADTRVLVTGDFALRDTAGLLGGVWPSADYNVVIMEATHAWDTLWPTIDTSANHASLLAACQRAIDQGATRVLVSSSALGDAQEAYHALCQAQAEGRFNNFTLRLGGKAALVAEQYQRSGHFSRYDPWRNPIAVLSSADYIPNHSIVIAGGAENADGIGRELANTIADMKGGVIISPTAPDNQSENTYSLSLHASFRELLATALALRCQQVALYHGAHSNPDVRSPLTTHLEQFGKPFVALNSTPKRIGE